MRTKTKTTQVDCIINSSDAIEKAKGHFINTYGNKVMEFEPFEAKLIEDSIWEVRGTLDSGKKGGVPIIKIRKTDCVVISIIHEK
jgi:hypothetical protein